MKRKIGHSPILTILIPSSSKNFNATDTFSNFCDLNTGFWLCFGSFFCASTSIKLISRRPSDKSHSKSSICLFTVFSFSFAHLVNVFCCVRFHWASSSKSCSYMSSSSSSAFSHLTDLSFSHILSAGSLLRDTTLVKVSAMVVVFTLCAFTRSCSMSSPLLPESVTFLFLLYLLLCVCVWCVYFLRWRWSQKYPTTLGIWSILRKIKYII